MDIFSDGTLLHFPKYIRKQFKQLLIGGLEWYISRSQREHFQDKKRFFWRWKRTFIWLLDAIHISLRGLFLCIYRMRSYFRFSTNRFFIPHRRHRFPMMFAIKEGKTSFWTFLLFFFATCRNGPEKYFYAARKKSWQMVLAWAF